MKIKNKYKSCKILFKRWTRTRWAVFTSLKIVVHNHCTKTSSFKDSLFKQQGANRTESINLFDERDTMSEFAAMEVPWEEESFLKISLLDIITTKTIETKEVLVTLLSNYYMISADKFNVRRDFFIPYLYEKENN